MREPTTLGHFQVPVGSYLGSKTTSLLLHRIRTASSMPVVAVLISASALVLGLSLAIVFIFVFCSEHSVHDFRGYSQPVHPQYTGPERGAGARRKVPVDGLLSTQFLYPMFYFCNFTSMLAPGLVRARKLEAANIPSALIEGKQPSMGGTGKKQSPCTVALPVSPLHSADTYLLRPHCQAPKSCHTLHRWRTNA